MKAKTFQKITLTVLLGLSLFVSAKIIKSDYKFLRTEFSTHAKNLPQHVINSFFN